MIEAPVHAPALGVFPWDPWVRGALAPGPEVVLVADHRPGRTYPLSRSPSGSHVLHAPPPLGADPAPARIELRDKTRQILSIRAKVSLPHPVAVAMDPLAVPGAPAGTVPVFPHPARPAPGGWVCLRAWLRRESTGKPVPWALMEVRLGPELVAVGLSDAEGAVAAALPAPAPRKRPLGLPEGAPFETAAWTFSVRFRWAAARLADALPDLDDLAAQAVVEPDTTPAGAMDAVLARPGENILASATRPAWGEAPATDRSSFLFLNA